MVAEWYVLLCTALSPTPTECICNYIIFVKNMHITLKRERERDLKYWHIFIYIYIVIYSIMFYTDTRIDKCHSPKEECDILIIWKPT